MKQIEQYLARGGNLLWLARPRPAAGPGTHRRVVRRGAAAWRGGRPDLAGADRQLADHHRGDLRYGTSSGGAGLRPGQTLFPEVVRPERAAAQGLGTAGDSRHRPERLARDRQASSGAIRFEPRRRHRAVR
ncbi:MAG: hypothetical protein MZV65_52855 [Chromatiales bacterium]|nr:hypothetical protein [Chromatiales bacterium]